MTFSYIDQPIVSPETASMSGNARVLIQTQCNNWFLVKRDGERSWVAECVAEANEPNYGDIATKTIRGNSKTILGDVDDALEIKHAYRIESKRIYRMAMISILSTGKIDTSIEVRVIED